MFVLVLEHNEGMKAVMLVPSYGVSAKKIDRLPARRNENGEATRKAEKPKEQHPKSPGDR